MKIVINSHIKSSIALNHLLDSMKKYEDFYSYKIIIMIGGFYDNNDYIIHSDENDNITYIYCNHNSIDFTGLITLMELYSSDTDEYYLYLHDTCKIGCEFYNKLKSIDLSNITSLKINK